MKYKIKMVVQILRVLLIYPWIDWKNSLMIKDLWRWKQLLKITKSDGVSLAQILWEKQEFRNLFIYRHSKKLLVRSWMKMIYPPVNTLFIETPEIGGGLFIQHGFSTMISAKSIGENCWINQQVTIGHTGKGCPVIGDNVMITCGAKVLGDITIGNNVVIGANAVVVKNVDDNQTMVGIPARPLEKKKV